MNVLSTREEKISSPLGFVVGGIGGISAAVVAGVVGFEPPFRRNGTTAVGDTPRSGIHERNERSDFGARRMFKCMFRLRRDLFACGTYLQNGSARGRGQDDDGKTYLFAYPIRSWYIPLAKKRTKVTRATARNPWAR